MSACVLHAEDRPVTATVGHLCGGHAECLKQMLVDVIDEAALLDAMPAYSSRPAGHSSGLASERSPARLEVLVHRDHRRGTGRSETPEDEHAAGTTLSVLDVLHSWGRMVREERHLADRAAVTAVGESALLVRNLDWVAAQPWVDECYAEVRELLSQLRAANGHAPDRPYSHCPVVLDGQECAGRIWIHDAVQPVWRPYADRCTRTYEAAPGPAVCDTCGSRWATDAERAYLSRMIAQQATERTRPRTEDGRPMRTAEELVADGLACSVGAVKTAASRRGHRAVRGHYDPDIITASKVPA